MQTMMIDLPAVAARIPSGKGNAGRDGQSFAQFFDKLPVNLCAGTQEEGLAGLLAGLTSVADGVLPKSGETSLLELLLNDSSQLDPELRTALELGLQEGSELSMLAAAPQVATELPVAVAPQVATELSVAVAPQVATELPVAVAPQVATELPVAVAPQVATELSGAEPHLGVTGNQPAAILAGEVALSSVIKWENKVTAMAKEPMVTDTDNAASLAVMPTVESGLKQKSVSGEAPPLLDNLLEKMLGEATPGRRQMIASRNESREQGQREVLSFDPSVKAEFKPTTAEIAAPASFNQAINGLLQPGNDAPAVVATSPVVIDTGSQGGQVLEARQAAMPEPAAAPGTGLRLSSGLLVPEDRIVDQVVGRLSISRGRESSSMTMKLHPEELGEVKLSLLVDKESVRAQFVVHSQQVQEILDRHMPRLREALAQQGLKLEDVQVSVDSRQGDGNKGLFQDQNQASTPFRFAVSRGGAASAGNELPVQLGQGPMKSGLSIRI